MRIATRLKLVSIVAVAAVAILAAGLLSLVSTYACEREEDRLANAIKIAALEAASSRDQYFLFREDRARVQWGDSYREVRRLLDLGESEFDQENERLLLRSLRQNVEDSERIFQRMGERAQDVEFDKGAAGELLLQTSAFLTQASNLSDIVATHLDETYTRLLIVSALFGVTLTLAMVLTAVNLGQLIRKRLVVLHEGARRVTDGDFDHRIPLAGTDELAELGQTINDMTDKLRGFTRRLEAEIQEREHTEQALRERERQLKRVIEGSDQGFWDWNLVTNEFSVSPRFETMLGYAPGEMDVSAENWPALVEPQDMGRAIESIELHLAGKSPAHELELRCREKSGEWRWILTRGRVVEWDAEGRPVRMSGTHTDISDRKRSEESLMEAMAEAEKANNAKSRFLAAASHDLRQPLSALSLYVGVLRQRTSAESGPLVGSIQNCVESLSELLTDLLDVSKLEAGVVTPKCVDFALDEMLESLVSVHASEGRLKGLRMGWRDTAAVVNTDATLFRRILGNFIANAIRYTKQGGILIGCRRHRGKRWVEVWDTGIGIPEDKIDAIFEPFRQLGDDARNRGSGLGLAIAAKTAKLLGLEIRVRSRPGRGSMFAVELPPGGSLSAVPAAPQAPGARSLRIALVEDNPTVLPALVMALERAAHEVVSAASRGALMSALGRQAPDIVISDYRLEGGETGLDVIAEVRRVFGNDVPALLITGDTGPMLIRSLANRGIAVHYKPLQMEALLAAIRQASDGEEPRFACAG